MTTWIVTILLKSTAVLLAAAALAFVLRRRSAGVRHLVWGAGLASVLVLPFVSVALPWRLRALPSFSQVVPGQAALSETRQTVPTVAETPPAAAELPASGPAAIETAGDTTPASVPFRPSPLQILLAIWVAGVVFACGRLVRGTILVRRVLAHASPLETSDWTRPLFEAADRLGLSNAPELVLSDRAPMPFACGVRRPILVMPGDASEWRDRRRRAVLSHELAHLRRHDLGMNALAQAACALYWFHPLVWVAARRLRLEAERACDDLVLGIGTRPSEYADHLLQIVCRAARMQAPVLALPLAQRREFEGRMLAILERDAPRLAPSPRTAGVFAALALALIVPLAALVPAAAVPEMQDGATAAVPTSLPQPKPAVVTKQDSARRDTATRRQQGERPRSGMTAGRTVQDTGRRAVFYPDSSGALTSGPIRRSQGDSVPKVVAALIRALDDSERSVRLDATYALGQRRAFAALNQIGTRLASDPSAEVREMAAWSLGQLLSPSGVKALGTAARTDTSRAVRAMAVWALGQIDDATAVPDLTAVLSDRSAEVRGRAAWALGTIRPTPAPDALIAALRDSSASVRYRAAWALGHIRDPRAVNGLSAAFKDADSEVRDAALWAIGQMRGDAAQDALVVALSDSNSKVRAAAARALSGGHSNPWPWPWPMPLHR